MSCSLSSALRLALTTAVCVVAGFGSGVSAESQSKTERDPDRERAELNRQRPKTDLPVGTGLRVVGVRDGVLQFRLNDKLVEGEAALTAEVRKLIANAQAKLGTSIDFYLAWPQTTDVKFTADQDKAIRRAICAAGPEVRSIQAQRVGIVSSDWNSRTHVWVELAGAGKLGNSYRLAVQGGKPQEAEGDEALKKALQEALAAARAKVKAKEDAEARKLSVHFNVHPEPGLTATEEQIAAARKAIVAAEVDPDFKLERSQPPTGSGTAPLRFLVAGARNGQVVYRRVCLDPVELVGQEALVREVAQVLKERDAVEVTFKVLDPTGVTREALEAASAACKAAGAEVTDLPDLSAKPPPMPPKQEKEP